MKPIRMIAVDMDGTLLDSSQQIPKENAQALIEAARAGIAVVICSGRMVEDVSRFARESDIPCMIASGNGARLLGAPLPQAWVLAGEPSTVGSSSAIHLESGSLFIWFWMDMIGAQYVP